MIFRYAVYARSKRQLTIAYNTAEAELVGQSWATKAALGFRNVLGTVMGLIPYIKLINDNQAAISIASGSADIRGVRHLVIASLSIIETYQKGIMAILWKNTKELSADMLTKVLPHSEQTRLRAMLNFV